MRGCRPWEQERCSFQMARKSLLMEILRFLRTSLRSERKYKKVAVKMVTSEIDAGSSGTPEPSIEGGANPVPESPKQMEGSSEGGAAKDPESGEKTGETTKPASTDEVSTDVAPYAPTVGKKWAEEANEDFPPKSRYRDFSRVPADPDYGHPSGGKGKSKDPTFPVKLHMILSNPEFQDIICWLPHGRSWRILQQRAFEERIIPLFFRHGRYSSFARQVNGWGFKRVTHGSDYNSYYHEMFLRGIPHLCHNMRRLTSKDTANRKEADGLEDSDFTPDFYSISRAFPVPESPFPAMAPRPLYASPLPGFNPTLGTFNPSALANYEAAMVERQQRAELVERLNAIEAVNALSAQQHQRADPFMAASLLNAQAMRQPQAGMLPMGMGSFGMNQAVGMHSGPPNNSIPQQALSNPFLAASSSNSGVARMGNNNAALETELLAAQARGTNPDLSLLLALNNAGMGGSYRGM